MDETYIHDYVRNTFNKYYIKEESLKNISSYIKYCLISQPGASPASYGYMVYTDKYITTDGSFKQDLIEILHKLVSLKFKGSVVTEKELLTKHTEIFDKLKTDSILFIQDCPDAPMTESEERIWKEIAESFRKNPHVVPVLMASSTVIKERFRANDDLFFRIFSYRIFSKSILSVSEVEQEMTDIIHDHMLVEDKSFENEIHTYIETVYPKADLQGLDFVNDLISRILRSYCRKDSLDRILDSSCVPFYKKDTSSTNDISAPQVETLSVEGKKAAPSKDKVNSKTIDIKDFINIKADESSDKDIKNVLLLALSTFPKNLKMDENKYSGTFAGTEYSGTYFYQMEPIIDLLSNHLREKGEHIDEVIILSTKETEEQAENVTLVTKDKVTNTVIVSDRETPSRVSPLEFLIYCVNKRNPEMSTKFSIHDCSSLDSTNMAKTIHEVLTEIRENKKANIYFDIHGGLRSTQQLVSSILSLLHLEGIKILSDNVFSVVFDPNTGISYIENAGSTFRIMDFVSGMNEFMAYGRTDSLERFYKNEKKAINASSDNTQQTDSDSEAIGIFKEIASGIQLCDMNSFDKGLKKLTDFDSSMQKTNSFLSIFWNDVQANYKGLLGSDITVLDKIKWCIAKGFYQQALTLIESKMPEELLIKLDIFNLKNNLQELPTARVFSSDEILENFKCREITSGTIYDLKKILDTNKPEWVGYANYFFDNWAKSCYHNKKTNNQKNKDKNNIIYLDLKGCLDSLKRQKRDNIKKLQNLKAYIKSIPFACDPSCCVEFYTEPKSVKSGKRVRLNMISKRKNIQTQLEQFVYLHLTLKNQRNSSNHASDDSCSMEQIEWALQAYVSLAEECFYNNQTA